MLPASCAWLARRARRPPGLAATGVVPSLLAVAWWGKEQVASFSGGARAAAAAAGERGQHHHGDEARRHPPSLTSKWEVSGAASQRRAFSSSSGSSSDGGAGDAAASSAAAAATLQAELAALNRELADVFGEAVADGPAGGPGGSFAASSSSFAPPPVPPPPPPPPQPTAADARLSHVEPRSGRASMVDVSSKPPSLREARASCLVRLSRRAASAVAANALKKGDVLGTARLAGIMAAKKTSDLIPLCHPLLLSRADVTAELVATAADGGQGGGAEGEEEDDEVQGGEPAAAGASSPAAAARAVRVACVARVGGGATGVEMEALTGAAVAALTVYDMVKAVGKGAAVVTDLRLDYKVGGKSGSWARRGLEQEDPGGAALLRAAAAEAAEALRGGGGGG